MSDSVELRINDLAIKEFSSYSIDSDLMMAACAFFLDLSNTSVPVTIGSQCKIFVNGVLELVGQVETIEEGDDKQKSSLTVSGRDLMGIVVDSCAETSDYEELKGFTVVAAARHLTRRLPFISRKNFKFQDDCIQFATAIGSIQVDPGMKIFDLLNRYASMRSLIFYCLPDGTMVFGKPKARPAQGDPKFSLIRRLSGVGNNIKSLKKKQDISGSYSDVYVISQSGGGGGSFGDSDVSAHKTNPDFPAGIYKPLVVTQNGDADSPAALARLLVERMRRESLSFEYTVLGHSQNGANWKINTFSSVLDEKRNVKGDYLIYGRTFTKSKTEGTQTLLRLGRGGLA